MRKALLLIFLLIISTIPIAAQEDTEKTIWQAIAMSPTSGDVVIITEDGLENAFVIEEFDIPPEEWDWSSEATISPDGRLLAFVYKSAVPTMQVDPNPVLIANLDDDTCCIELALPEGALPGTNIGTFSEDSTQLRIFVQFETTQNGVATTRAESVTYDLTTSPPEIISNIGFIPYITPTEDTRNILGTERVRTGMQTGIPIPTVIRENGFALGAGAGNAVAYYSGDATPIVLYSREDTAHTQAVWGMNGNAVLVRYDDYPVRPNNATVLFRDGAVLDAEFDVNDIFILHGTPDGWILLLDRFDTETPSRLAHLTVVDGEAQLDILADDLPVDIFLILKPTLTYEGEAEFIPFGDGEEFVPFAG